MENTETEAVAATPIDASLQQAVSEIPEVWGGQKAQHLINVRKSKGIIGTKHGMYASVPMICKGVDCPFRATCWIPEKDLVIGERCPIEVATIMEQYEHYCTSLEIAPTDVVDQGLVKQLIDVEVAMLRADSKMASSPDLIREVVDSINQKTGDVYYKTEIDPVLLLKSDLRKEHHRILNQLQATRKDKKDTLLGRQDPSSMAAALIQRFRSVENQGKIIDAEVVESVSEEVKADASP